MRAGALTLFKRMDYILTYGFFFVHSNSLSPKEADNSTSISLNTWITTMIVVVD